jgi:gluconolactonase
VSLLDPSLLSTFRWPRVNLPAMIRPLAIVFVLLLGASMSSAADEFIAEEKVRKLAGGMQFVEGPVWTNDNGGFLVFSDIPADEIFCWNEPEGLTQFRTPSHNANGNTRDREGRLITCEHGSRRVTRLEKDRSITILAESFEGKKLNSPNDIVVKSDGTIFFTDPTYGIKKPQQEQPAQYVFRLNPDTKELTPLVKDFVQPNGLCFSPDEKLLYIADSGGPNHIRVFDVQPDNTLANGRVHCKIDHGVPDGIRCDAKGNVWSSAGDGIQIFSAEGRLLARIPVPESPANLAFGGPDDQALFITARSSLYTIRTKIPGAQRPSTGR